MMELAGKKPDGVAWRSEVLLAYLAWQVDTEPPEVGQQLGGGRIAIFAPLGEALPQDVAQGLGNGRRQGSHRRRVVAQQGLHGFEVACTLEWYRSAESLVE